MYLRKIIVPVLLCLGGLVDSLAARNVFVFPSGTSTTQVTSVFAGDPFGPLNSFLGSPFSSLVVAHPNGSRYYVAARSGSDSLVVVDGTTFQVLRRYNFGQAVEALMITPDGRRVIAAAGSLRMIDTSTDNEISLPSIDVGVTPIDLAVSLDSTRLFVLSSSSQRLTAVDLATNSVVGTSITVPGLSTGVTAAPNGLIYVSTQNRIYEIDGRTMTVRAEIPLNAQPGKLAVTPDGRFGVVVNRTPVTGSSVIVVDLSSRSINTIPNFNVVLDRVVVVGNNRVLITSQQTQSLYDVQLSPATITVASFGSIGTPSGVLAAVTSNEVPSPRFLFVVTASIVYRIDLQGGFQLSGQMGLATGAGGIGYAGPATTGTATGIQAFNQIQSAALNTAYLPLVIRVTDSTGRPLAGVPVTFSSSDVDLILQGAATTTSADGFAQVIAIAPNKIGQYTVTANAGSGAAVTTFTLSSGTGTGGTGGTGSAGGLFIVGGNGQAVREQFLASEPLAVVVRDANGNPVPNVSVTFSITSGAGDLVQSLGGLCSTSVSFTLTCTTDVNGQVGVAFKASNVIPGFSFTPTTITASAGTATVNFVVTTYLNQFQGGLAADPTTNLIKPTEGAITGQAGQTVAGAIQVRVFSTVGPQAGSPMPNIGVKVSTGNDPALLPTAACSGPGGVALTDATGTATCDLVIGPKIGVAPLTVSVGGFANLAQLQLTVTPGVPAVFQLLQGNNQTGNAGAQLPLALLAQIQDAFGNPLPGTQVQWEVVTPGTVTLRNIINTADSQGRVSALATLGGTPGAHQVRVRSGNAVGTFTLNVAVAFGSLTATSGSGQTGEINRPYSQPLVVTLRDTNGSPVPNSTVTFAVSSGNATLSSTSATTNASGQASVNVTAGSTAGPVVVTATVAGFTATFNLTNRLPGPVFSLANFLNGASFNPVPAIAPGMILTITGTGIAPGVQGVVAPGTLVGPLPFSVASVDVQFNNIQAPIYSVANIGGQESVTVQVPFEVPVGSPATVTIRVAGGSTTISNVPVLNFQPGIFETVVDGRRIAVAERPDGTFVTPGNPARRGERIRFFVTGFGQVTGGTGTNRAGVPGQTVIAPFNVGIANAGVPVISAEYLPGIVGVYIITLEVPLDAPAGADIAFNVSVTNPDGSPAFSQRASLPIQ